MNVWQPEWPEWPSLNNSLYILVCTVMETHTERWSLVSGVWSVVSGVCEISGNSALLEIFIIYWGGEQEEVSAAWRWLWVWLPPAAPVPHWQSARQHRHTTPCVSPELRTRWTTRRLRGWWRRSLGATTPAPSSSTCCSTSCLPTLSSKSEIWTVSGMYMTGHVSDQQ